MLGSSAALKRQNDIDGERWKATASGDATGRFLQCNQPLEAEQKAER